MTSIEEAEQTERAIKHLTVPATGKWIVGRIAALLSHYYAAELPDQVHKALANDWAAELKGKPAWAISNACRWWMSAENKNRRKRPIPGDIAERAEEEMARVRAAEIMLSMGISDVPQIEQEPRGQEIPLERRREVAQELIGKVATHVSVGRGGEE